MLRGFDPDDPTLMDRYPTYIKNIDIGDRPPTPNQQRQTHFSRKAKVKQTTLFSMKVI